MMYRSGTLFLLLFTALSRPADGGPIKIKGKQNSVLKDPTEEGPKSCEALSSVIRTFFHDFVLDDIPPAWKNYQAQVIQYNLGLNFDDNEALNKFSCRLADVKTVRELAGLLRMPVDDVAREYGRFQMTVSMSGGVQGLQDYLSLTQILVEAARFAGFPKWPLNVTYQDAYDFFEQLIEEYGADFPMLLAPYSHQHVVVNNLKGFVKHLVNSRSLRDFLRRTGLNNFLFDILTRKLRRYAVKDQVYKRDMRRGHALANLASVAQKFGLIDLRDDSGVYRR